MKTLAAILILLFILPFSGCGCAKKWDVLSPEEKMTLYRIRTHWERWVPERKKEGTAPLLTFEELYTGLSPEEKLFLNRIRAINPKSGQYSNPIGEIKFRRIDGQWIVKDGKRERKIDPQYLPEAVYEVYEKMMKSMEEDLGKRLLVESGYRSPAYQLYVFLFYLPKHRYSLVETGQWIALPGYSEHGAPHKQAIDFINEQGINGEINVEEFERLPEYGWLLKNAGKFGFELSYPRGRKGITFEPWHWRVSEPVE